MAFNIHWSPWCSRDQCISIWITNKSKSVLVVKSTTTAKRKIFSCSAILLCECEPKKEFCHTLIHCANESDLYLSLHMDKNVLECVFWSFPLRAVAKWVTDQTKVLSNKRIAEENKSLRELTFFKLLIHF